MTLAQALIALAEGKKVKCQTWSSQFYIHLVDNQIVDEKLKHFHFIGDRKWELYEEPKKKITLIEWRVEEVYGRSPFTFDEWVTEEEAKRTWPDAKLTPLRSFEVEEI